MAGLKGMGRIDIPAFPEGAITLPEGTVRLPEGGSAAYMDPKRLVRLRIQWATPRQRMPYTTSMEAIETAEKPTHPQRRFCRGVPDPSDQPVRKFHADSDARKGMWRVVLGSRRCDGTGLVTSSCNHRPDVCSVVTDMRRIDLDDPEVDIDYDHRLLYQGEPYTGEAEEYLQGQRVSLVTYADGYKDGPFHEWYKSGALRAEGMMRNGFASGEFKRWHENGILAKKAVNSEDGGTLIAEFEWDEEGHPTRAWPHASA